MINSNKKRLLLHTCCCPCLLGSIERIVPFFDVTVFFYNPNIDTKEEFELRLNQLYKIGKTFDIKKIIAIDYDHSQFLKCAEGLLDEKEGGVRCKNCFELRLKFTAQYAFDSGFDAFATTLTLSPHKNAKLINQIGQQACEDFESKLEYIPSDFKKQEGVKRSGELCREFKVYRQIYCGCKRMAN